MKINTRLLTFTAAAVTVSAVFQPYSILAISPSISPWECILSEDSTGVAEEDHCPDVAVAGQTVHAIWTSNIGDNLHNLCYRRSLDSGVTWQNRTNLQSYGSENAASMTSGDTTRLAVSGNTVHVIQARYVAGWHYEIDYFRSLDGGATFEERRTLYRGPDGWTLNVPRIRSEGGCVVVALGLSQNWGVQPSGHMLFSTDGGTTFSSSEVVSAVYAPYDWNWGVVTCVDLKLSGNKVASVWRTNGTVPFLAVTANADGTGINTLSLSTARTESWTPPSQMQPQVCAIAGNISHMAWDQRNASGRSALFYTRSVDGGATVETPRDLSEGTIGTDEVRGGRVIVAAQGTHVYVCYVANSSGGVWLRASSDSGATFDSAVPLHISNSGLLGNGEYPCLALDPNDASGATAWFAFTVTSAYSGCAANAVGHTTDGWATRTPLLVPAHAWIWPSGSPHSFRLAPGSDAGSTAWTMLYVGRRYGQSDADLYARRFTQELAPTSGNKVLHLDGLASASRYDTLEVPSVSALQFSTNLTAEMWVRVTPGALMERGLEILQWGREDTALAFRGFSSGGGNFAVSGRIPTTSGNYSVGGCPITGDGAWHHLALSYDATGGPFNLRFYVDGHLYHSVTATGAFIPAQEPLMVGGISSGWGLDPLNGDVDDLRLWNRTLSEDEIRASAHQAQLSGSEPGLAAAFSFDGTVQDLSGHGADGLLQFGADYRADTTVSAALMREWTDDFASGTLRSAYWQTNASALSFAVDTSLGDVRVSKPAGSVGSDEFLMDSVWQASGDFDASVDFSDAVLTRSQAWGNHLALVCRIGSTGYYFIRSDENGIGHNLSVSEVPGAGRLFMRATSATTGTLRLIRRGTQLSGYFDGELFYQVSCATAPMTFALCLFNNTTPDAISATFDNVKISATSLQPRWNSFSTYVFAKGLDGAAADRAADPDGDGASNLLEYGAGTDPASSTSAPPAFVLGTVGEAPGGPYFTFTTRLAKPIPSDLDVGAEFSMDLGAGADWTSAGIGVTDTDQGDHIDRTFRSPFIIGYPPAGFMRLKLDQH